VYFVEAKCGMVVRGRCVFCRGNVWHGCESAHSLYKIHTFLSQPCHALPLQNTHLPLTTMPHFASTKYTPSSHNHATLCLYKIHTFLSQPCHTLSLGTPASSTTKTGRYDIAEKLPSGAKHQKSNHNIQDSISQN
jgi:hypothetical protein